MLQVYSVFVYSTYASIQGAHLAGALFKRGVRHSAPCLLAKPTAMLGFSFCCREGWPDAEVLA